MGNHRLLENLSHISPEQAERLFGNECLLNPPDPALTLAPVKRVAIFAEAFLPKVDGVSKTAFLTMRYLQQTGREVLVFAPDIAVQSVGTTKVIPLPSLGMPSAPETRIALPHPSVAQHLNDFQPDLIHLFNPALLSWSGIVVGRQNRIPIIANYQTDLPAYAHHYGYPFLSTIIREYLRRTHNACHLTLAPSSWTIDELHRDGYHRLRRWGRGVNSQHFSRAQFSQTMRDQLLNGRDPNALLCIYVGRLANEKRIDLLLEAARTPGIALTIIGDGARRPELEDLFAGTGTHFTGYMFGDELARAYASSDVFMFTGMSETFGQVVQEAMASGLPSIIVDQGGIVDLIDDGVEGFVCPADADAFAAAVRRLRDDPALRAQMGYNARLRAEATPWESVMAQLEGFYTEAVRMNERISRMHPPAPGLLARFVQRGAPSARTFYDRVS